MKPQYLVLFILTIQASLQVIEAWEITKTSINKQEKAVLKVGEEAVLTCTADVKVEGQGCSFYGGLKPLDGYTLNNEYSKYKKDGIEQASTGENDCSMKILSLDHDHNGEWKCVVTVCIDDCDSKHETIDLIVAQKPSQTYLETADNTKIQSSLFMNLTTDTEMKVKCVTKGANPQPRFKWSLHDTQLTNHVEREENGSYISELTYEGDLEHNEKTLKCEIEQEGYTEEDEDAEKNIVQVVMEIVGDPPGSLAMSIGITAAVLALIGLIAGAVYVYMTKIHQSNSNETESIGAEEDFALNPKKEIP